MFRTPVKVEDHVLSPLQKEAVVFEAFVDNLVAVFAFPFKVTFPLGSAYTIHFECLRE
jgi:hypothetical protein